MTLRRLALTFAFLILFAGCTAMLASLGGCSASGGGYHFSFLRDSLLSLETNHQADPNRP